MNLKFHYLLHFIVNKIYCFKIFFENLKNWKLFINVELSEYDEYGINSTFF